MEQRHCGVDDRRQHASDRDGGTPEGDDLSDPSWHPSLASSVSSSSSAFESADSDPPSCQNEIPRERPPPTISERVGLLLYSLLTGSSPGGTTCDGARNDDDNSPTAAQSGDADERRRRVRRRAAAASLAAAVAFAFWCRTRRRRRSKLQTNGGAAALTAATATATAAAVGALAPPQPSSPIVASTTALSVASSPNGGGSSNIGAPYRHRHAAETPLSLFLHHAKRGNVTRALLNGTAIAFQLSHVDSGDATSTTTQGKAGGSNVWLRSKIPQSNPSLQSEVMTALSEGQCHDIDTLPEPLSEKLLPIAIASVPFVYLALVYRMLKNMHSSPGGDLSTNDELADEVPGNDGQKRRRTTFADVAGIDAAKLELAEIVRYLTNPAPYHNVGARPPSGVLLHGPPGNGKTLLARAVAGEARADYFATCSGSDFVELYVGQGARRVRELFRSVRDGARRRHRREVHRFKLLEWWMTWVGSYLGLDVGRRRSSSGRIDRPPTAVLFIDEIDALAKCRDGIGRGSYNLGGGAGTNDEREQTLNALLTEMDGFGTFRNGGGGRGRRGGRGSGEDVAVIVVAATNRPSVLDPALLRPGRFDRHVLVPCPDRVGREAILRVHARRIRLDDDANDVAGYDDATARRKVESDVSTRDDYLSALAADRYTANFSGADLCNVINEAALLSVRAGRLSVGWTELVDAAGRVRRMKGYAD